jgi:phosphonate metabolism protein PhnN/1,5-bisphosphokinase (PRPP-forming)
MTGGRIFAVVGPSGAGKDTLLVGAIRRDPGLHWARRTITRAEVAGGEPFEGVSRETFRHRCDAGDFALHWAAHGLNYGIATTEFAALKRGGDVVFNGSRAALPAAQAVFGDLIVLRVTAPSRELARRLAARGRETAAEIEARLARTIYDLPAGLNVIDIANDGLPEVGVDRLLAAIHSVRG